MFRLLFGFLLVRAASSVCNCIYAEQPPPPWNANNWPTFYIENPMDNSSSKESPCSRTCTFHLDSGDDSQGIGGYIQYQWENDSGANYLSIYNADKNFTEDTANPLAFNVTRNVQPSFVSSSRYVVLELTVVNPVTILVGMIRMPLATTSTTPSTPKPAATTPYSGPYSRNPHLISNDVLFMVDGGGNGQRPQAFNESRLLAAAIVDAFDPTAVFALNATHAPTYGSRMALRYLTTTNYGNIGMPWNELPSFISNQIKNLFQITNFATPYLTALNDLLNQTDFSPFSVNNKADYAYQNSRNTSQRLLVIVASSVPSDLNDLTENTTKELFTNLDVHPIFVAYNMTNSNVSTVKNALAPFWGVISIPDLSNLTGSVERFFDGYLLDATNVCYVNTTIPAPSTDETQEIHYPANYVSKKDSWDEDHQKARYCNFQTITYNFEPPVTGGVLNFSVNYELEAGRDFLTFYREDGSEEVTLSGEDVGPSVFYTKGNTRAVFTSNENQVFGGFSITYRAVSS